MWVRRIGSASDKVNHFLWIPERTTSVLHPRLNVGRWLLVSAVAIAAMALLSVGPVSGQSTGVALTVIAEPSAVTSGATVQYSIRVTNGSSAPAQNVTASVPAGDSGAPGALPGDILRDGLCQPRTGTVVCPFGTIQPGGSGTVVLTVITAAPGTYNSTFDLSVPNSPASTVSVTVSTAPPSSRPSLPSSTPVGPPPTSQVPEPAAPAAPVSGAPAYTG